MKPTPKGRRPSRQSCVFKEPFVREQIDPRVKSLWEKTTGKPAPFGRLRMNFQREHCSKINPYAGECPYRVEECGMAFLSAVQASLLPWIEDPAAYFVKVARSAGIERADNKPLAREQHRDVHQAGDDRSGRSGHGTGRPGDLAHVRGVHPSQRLGAEVLDEEDHLRRAHVRPNSIGSLLGALNLGPHQGRTTDGSEGDK
jgi:hypothetical protein